MFLNPALGAALDRVAERAADVRRAFVPGASPERGDVAAATASSSFTLDPLSTAPPDGSYFLTRDARGRIAYTRDGSFHCTGGRLVDERGNAVLGTRTSGSPLGDVCVDAVDDALGRANALRIDPDGTFSYARTMLDPRTGARETQRIVAGRLALARFPAGTKLESAGDVYSFAPPGVTPHTGAAGDGAFGALQPMQRERSGVDLDASLARLKEAFVAFDALQAAETAKGRTGKTAMDLVK